MTGLKSEMSCTSDLGANVPETFEHLLKSEPELATAAAAIKTLIIVLEKCNAKTLQELIKSDTAIRLDINNNPNSGQIEKLKALLYGASRCPTRDCSTIHRATGRCCSHYSSCY